MNLQGNKEKNPAYQMWNDEEEQNWAQAGESLWLSIKHSERNMNASSFSGFSMGKKSQAGSTGDVAHPVDTKWGHFCSHVLRHNLEI